MFFFNQNDIYLIINVKRLFKKKIQNIWIVIIWSKKVEMLCFQDILFNNLKFEIYYNAGLSFHNCQFISITRLRAHKNTSSLIIKIDVFFHLSVLRNQIEFMIGKSNNHLFYLPLNKNCSQYF